MVSRIGKSEGGHQHHPLSPTADAFSTLSHSLNISFYTFYYQANSLFTGTKAILSLGSQNVVVMEISNGFVAVGNSSENSTFQCGRRRLNPTNEDLDTHGAPDSNIILGPTPRLKETERG